MVYRNINIMITRSADKHGHAGPQVGRINQVRATGIQFGDEDIRHPGLRRLIGIDGRIVGRTGPARLDGAVA